MQTALESVGRDFCCFKLLLFLLLLLLSLLLLLVVVVVVSVRKGKLWWRLATLSLAEQQLMNSSK